jgi:hypothetical protein
MCKAVISFSRIQKHFSYFLLFAWVFEFFEYPTLHLRYYMHNNLYLYAFSVQPFTKFSSLSRGTPPKLYLCTSGAREKYIGRVE